MCFLPSILLFSALVFLTVVLNGARGEPGVGPMDVLADSLEFLVKGFIGLGLPLFLAADWLLSRRKWYGALLGMLPGAYYIYNFYVNQLPHRKIIARTDVIGTVICAYYLLWILVLLYQKRAAKK